MVDATKAADGAKDSHQNALFDAISKSDLETVQKILKEEPEWSTLRDDMNRTPLMAACLYDNTEVVTEIIEALDGNHSEVNKWTTPSRNPALESPEIRKILTLLALSGEKLRNVEMRKHTALVIASEGGHLSILQLLVKHGADINQNHGSTALRSACMRGHLDCVEWLLENSADASLVNKDTGSTPLLVAVFAGSEEIVALLLKHGNNGLNTAVAGYDGLSALHAAASQRNPAILGMLLHHGANIHATSKRGWTALDHAVIRQSVGIQEASVMVDMLLARGAKVPPGTFCRTFFLGGGVRSVASLWSSRVWKLPSEEVDDATTNPKPTIVKMPAER